MGGKKNGNRGYGYAYTGASTSNNVQLPNVIPCNRCAVKKGHNCYSKNRLADLKDHVYKTPRFNATTQGFVSCMECSGAGAQQLEIFCIGCDRTLPHQRFSKVQRRTPDHARCEACQMKRNDLEPGAVSSDDDSRHDDFDNNSDDFDDASSLNSLVSLLAHRRQSFSETAATFSTLSVNESRAQGGVSINSGSALNGNGYSTASKSRATSMSNRDIDVGSTTTNATVRTGWTTTTTASTSNALPTGFNANACGTPPHLRARTEPAPSTRSDAMSSGGGKFAKIKASDAVRRPKGRPKTKAKPAPVPGEHDDDDIGVASSDSDD